MFFRMRTFSIVARSAKFVFGAAGVFLFAAAFAQSNVNVRIMAANLNGNTQSYQPFALRIFQGTLPDVVAIQEFNYTSTNHLGTNTPAAFREMIDTAFGTSFVYYREPYTANGNIPNGIISRWPITASGSWNDTVQTQPNRGFAWAQIQLPGTNPLYIVSVHLLTSSAANRSSEATNLKNLIQANFPPNAWIVVAGDFNTGSRTESTTMQTFASYLNDFPVPVDNNGNSNTSANRNNPHDYVLVSSSLTNFETATVFPSHSFPNGLVFDSTVYTPLSDVSPVQFSDSTNAQHMAVMKDFSLTAGPATNPPVILVQPQGKTNAVGVNLTFAVTATGSGTLNYQWLFNGGNIFGATTNPFVLINAQLTNNGNYSVVVTNLFGSVTSSVTALLVTNAPPSITSQPQGLTVLAGQGATFSVSATGTPPLNYQWLFNGTNISGATTNPFSISNVQTVNAGNYSVTVTNFSGSVTSAAASLAIVLTNPTVFAQWNFNSAVNDTNTGTGATTPSIGNGTASAIGGVVASFVGGDSVMDPVGTNDNTAWTTTTYPASSAGNKTAGVQFAVSTAGKQNIAVSWSQRSSNTGGKYFRLEYSTNSGTSYFDYSTPAVVGVSFSAFTNNLASAPGVNNNSNFVFRIVAEFESTAIGSANANYVAAGTSYAPSGTTRYDMVTVSGTSFVSGSAATLTPLTFTNGVFSLGVTGAVTANYVIQTSTNLNPANWLPVFTNASPFSYGESNLLAPQKFYRAVAQ